MIDAILLDADGVVQTTSPEFRATLAAAVGESERCDQFVREVFLVERDALVGRGDFRQGLQGVLRRWDVRTPVDEIMRAWSMITTVPGMLEYVAELRAGRFPVFVASNQQPYRARYMSSGLGYADAFAGEFYSCALGAAKPDPAFFRAILRELDLEPDRLLFFDDHEPNVDAARGLGICAVQFDALAHAEPVAALRTLVEAHGVIPGGHEKGPA